MSNGLRVISAAKAIPHFEGSLIRRPVESIRRYSTAKNTKLERLLQRVCSRTTVSHHLLITFDRGVRSACGIRRFFRWLHSGFEATNALSDSLAQLRELLGTEHQQCDSENDQQVHGLQ